MVPAVDLVVHTGARDGELLALTWPDVDMAERMLAIRRTLTWARTRAEKAAGVKGPRLHEPMTRTGRRTLEIPEDLVPELRRRADDEWADASPESKVAETFNDSGRLLDDARRGT